jgi:hypothetical protein
MTHENLMIGENPNNRNLIFSNTSENSINSMTVCHFFSVASPRKGQTIIAEDVIDKGFLYLYPIGLDYALYIP